MNEDNFNDELSLDDLFSNIDKDQQEEKKVSAPFKFLDSYTLDDKDIFYGRDTEINEIYRKFYDTNILLIYGKSGTGKSSVVNCGLRAKIPTSDIFPITVRCGKEPYNNFITELTKLSTDKNKDAVKCLQNIYDQKFKPISIIFDQFEEVFILSTKEKRKQLIDEINTITQRGLSVNFIFIIREEYYANLTEFETDIPTIYANRIRIEKMEKSHIKEAILEPCKVCNVDVEEQLPEMIIEQLTKHSGQLELTWFQVLMDKLYKIAIERDAQNPILQTADLQKLGRIDNVLTSFVDEQLKQMDNGINGEAVLKTFVSTDGTKKQLKFDEIENGLISLGKKVPTNEVKDIVKYFTDVRILTDKDENGYYELRHDSIAAHIFERMTAMEKELSEVRKFIENSLHNYVNRQKLLDENDLNYIAPYVDKLILSEEQNELIQKSKRENQKRKNKKYRIIIISSVFLLVILSAFSIWAIMERQNAIQNQIIADKQKEKADSLFHISLKTNFDKFISEGNNAIDNNEFNIALEKYSSARTFIDTTSDTKYKVNVDSLNSLIDTLVANAEYIKLTIGDLNKILAEAESLYSSGQLYPAKLKYQEALAISNQKAEINAKISEINTKISVKVNTLLSEANNLISDYPDMAKKRLNNILAIDPNNAEAIRLLNSLK